MTPEELFAQIEKELKSQGIFLNPDKPFTLDLLAGILKNRERYGADYCPCRLITGNRDIDRQIVCPCDFRDRDIDETGQCFCGLFVNQEWINRGVEKQIPDRWLPEEQLAKLAAKGDAGGKENADLKHEEDHPLIKVTLQEMTVWWCPVCGYLALREHPPGKCPICGAKQDRFKPIKLAALTP